MNALTLIRRLMAISLLGLLMACGNGEDHHDHAEHESHDHGEEVHDHDHDHGDDAYYCPMHPEVTDDEPGSCPICGMDLVSDDDEDNGDHDHHDHDHDHDHEHEDGNGDGVWTCPMHPQIEEDEPGRCPICGMDLVQREGHDMEVDQVHVPAGMQQAMNIRTTTAEHGRLMRRIETVGRVEYDQSRLHHIHPRVEGWIHELDVDAEGDHVSQGDRLFTLYSPELINAQEELLQALRRGEGRVVEAARDRLRALDVNEEVIERLERERRVIQFVPWYAHQDAYVTQLGVRHGMYVEPGSEIMELADLSQLWVIADVFENQADWISQGQHAQIGLPYAPGRQLESEISHIYPTLDPVTRSVRVRLPVENVDTGLRPGMWNAVTIHAEPSEEAVIIPREAVIWTGRGNRVVIREDENHFRVREITPGMVSGDQIVILDGIEAGDEVVLSGHFLIDSEASIQGGHGRVEDHSDH
ncbi:Cu(I)/Ag(I) efflux system membrane fusion protein [Natronospira proteinivora]|uniref:Cu(I)/Ag(I) efflux system membrane fusion protein n=1 Tax=Natronospira proteinivora TaxID=1807133 RepID=A0ABT1G9H4_9GAMM|nr:efflux RND transporter periplasmic adaptor subunit [Natronospira proteinivora]MCP1727555.1 Cu(I)/Ag(I) efflux system membrane fusion protein [Natronospira proteinivora]